VCVCDGDGIGGVEDEHRGGEDDDGDDGGR